MARLFAVQSIRFQSNPSSTSGTAVTDIGFSILRLKALSGGVATGIRANLKIHDPDALRVLATHHEQNRDLQWVFGLGSWMPTLSVELQFTRFHRLTGSVQLARTAVMRDLVGEIDARTSSQTGTGDRASSPSPSANPSNPTRTRTKRRAIQIEEDHEDLKALWPKIFGGRP